MPQHMDNLRSALIALVGVTREIGVGANSDAEDDLLYWSSAALKALASCERDANLAPLEAASLAARLDTIGTTAQSMAAAMEFGFLFDHERRLLSIGCRPRDGSLDTNCYDLLASEARLASFVAIAKGDIPSRHWFRLGRAVVPVPGGAALISWSGSMFEYLMPSLVMRAPGGSLLEQTSRLIVRCQRRYAATLGLPWGISESAYNARDRELTYQYSNFGVPTLGLKRGLRDDAVVAPYATALAAMVEPAAAVKNLALLSDMGACGQFGFYEAIDFTRRRLPQNVSFAIVRAFMAHHQGMTIVSVENAIMNGRMRERFHADPSVRATELLLHERPPRDVSMPRPWVAERTHAVRPIDLSAVDVRRLETVQTRLPQTHLLSNGRLTVMITAAGAGYTRWKGLALTRWREYLMREHIGGFIYLRDVENRRVWSAAHQPTGVDADGYEITFVDEHVSITRRDGSLHVAMEVIVSPEDDAEARSVVITNTGSGTRIVEVTSYMELVLAPATADDSAPGFLKAVFGD